MVVERAQFEIKLFEINNCILSTVLPNSACIGSFADPCRLLICLGTNAVYSEAQLLLGQ